MHQNNLSKNKNFSNLWSAAEYASEIKQLKMHFHLENITIDHCEIFGFSTSKNRGTGV